MKTFLISVLAAAFQTVVWADEIPNPLIDYPGFLKNAGEVQKLREGRRVTEEEFIKLAAEPGTVVLDARSADRFVQLHVRHAVNLPFTEFTAETLAAAIPAKDTRILIYCNNNFLNAPRAFASKIAVASLNLNTFNSLYGYGYRNVYELGPLLDAKTARLPLEGALAKE